MADIVAFKNTMITSSEQGRDSQEMQQLKFQVSQYENILPVYQFRLKDTEDLNKKLGEDKWNLLRTLSG